MGVNCVSYLLIHVKTGDSRSNLSGLKFVFRVRIGWVGGDILLKLELVYYGVKYLPVVYCQ